MMLLTTHEQIHFNVDNRTYATPVNLHHMKISNERIGANEKTLGTWCKSTESLKNMLKA